MSQVLKSTQYGVYKSINVQRRGSPDMLQLVETNIRYPKDNEIGIKVLATPICSPDIQARYGKSPFAPSTPFTPGYAIIGKVDQCGSKIKSVKRGDLVASLTVYGGYTEYIYLKESQIIPVPNDIDPITAAPIILNYLVAHQSLHRRARVEKNDTILIIGASGGIGTAFLQLGQLAGLKMYGVASKSKHHILKQYGAIPIDYQSQDYVEYVKQHEPDGINAIFDGMDGSNLKNGFHLLKKGGTWVHYGNPESLKKLMALLGKYILYNLLPNKKSVRLYGTTSSQIKRMGFLEDWRALFELYTHGFIEPIIQETFPLDQAKKANLLLETGNVIGNLVLEVSL